MGFKDLPGGSNNKIGKQTESVAKKASDNTNTKQAKTIEPK